MSRWSNLPLEILNVVFVYVDTNEIPSKEYLSQCALTCRSWRPAAQRVYFQEISITKKEDIYNAKRILSRSEGANLGSLVKKLHLTCSLTSWPSEVNLKMELLDTIFPRIEVIDYATPDYIPNAFFDMILAGKFKYLKEIPDYRSGHQDKLYIKCALILKERLKHINIKYNPALRVEGTYENLIDKLDQFPCLESISAIVKSFNNNTIWDLLDSISSTGIQGPLRKACLQISSSNSKTDLLQSTDHIKPCYNLKQLEILYQGLVLNADTNLLYIKNKFPNLTSLTINRLISFKRSQMSSTCSSVMTIEFLKYIFERLCKTEIEHIVVDSQNVTDIITQFYNAMNFTAADSQNIMIFIQGISGNWYEGVDMTRSAMIDCSVRYNKEQHSMLRIRVGKYNKFYLDLIKNIGSRIHGGLFFDNVHLDPKTSLLDLVSNFCANLRILQFLGGFKLGNYSGQASPKSISGSAQKLGLSGYTLTKELFSYIESRLPDLQILRVDWCLNLNMNINLPNTNLENSSSLQSLLAKLMLCLTLKEFLSD